VLSAVVTALAGAMVVIGGMHHVLGPVIGVVRQGVCG
jgi:ABC-type branched-subunit amino acid transport system permease subunit